jgi:hypothetical protein
MKTIFHSLAAMLVMALLTTLCPAQEVVPAGKASDGGKIKIDASPKQPNIIIYMVDDLGWNHVSAAKATMGTHKGVYHTPNIESYFLPHSFSPRSPPPNRTASRWPSSSTIRKGIGPRSDE